MSHESVLVSGRPKFAPCRRILTVGVYHFQKEGINPGLAWIKLWRIMAGFDEGRSFFLDAIDSTHYFFTHNRLRMNQV